MPTKPTHSIAQQLNAAQVAINNSLKDTEILRLLGEYGYTAVRIKEGQKLYDAARQAVNLRQSLLGAQQDSTAKTKKVTKDAFAAYQALAKVARAVWIKDKAQLKALGLTGTMPKTEAGFLSAAYTLFDNATGNAELNKVLADYGYTKAKFASERAKIEAFDKSHQLQEAAKGAAQDATRSEQAALLSMNEWVARFTKIAKVALCSRKELLEKLGILARSGKTKKQRAAPGKAKATRAAKKGK